MKRKTEREKDENDKKETVGETKCRFHVQVATFMGENHLGGQQGHDYVATFEVDNHLT